MTDELDKLRPEVRQAFRRMDRDVPRGLETADEWTTIRAELLRLAGAANASNLSADTWEAKYRSMRERTEKTEAELAALKAAGRFAVGVMDAFWSPPDVGSLDGFDLQELAEKHGMLTRFDVPEGGCGEACNCICEGAKPGYNCYRWSETFKRVRTGVEE